MKSVARLLRTSAGSMTTTILPSFGRLDAITYTNEYLGVAAVAGIFMGVMLLGLSEHIESMSSAIVDLNEMQAAGLAEKLEIVSVDRAPLGQNWTSVTVTITNYGENDARIAGIFDTSAEPGDAEYAVLPGQMELFALGVPGGGTHTVTLNGTGVARWWIATSDHTPAELQEMYVPALDAYDMGDHSERETLRYGNMPPAWHEPDHPRFPKNSGDYSVGDAMFVSGDGEACSTGFASGKMTIRQAGLEAKRVTPGAYEDSQPTQEIRNDGPFTEDCHRVMDRLPVWCVTSDKVRCGNGVQGSETFAIGPPDLDVWPPANTLQNPYIVVEASGAGATIHGISEQGYTASHLKEDGCTTNNINERDLRLPAGVITEIRCRVPQSSDAHLVILTGAGGVLEASPPEGEDDSP